MKSIRQLFRLFAINLILARHGLDQLIVSIHLFAPLRFFVYCNPWNWRRKKSQSRGAALRKSLEELGPIFVKFGQALSTRPDILPTDIALELCKLQDNVAPFASVQVLNIVERTFGHPALEIFAEFDPKPLASASVAQVHAARLKTGEDVVVKILRPNINKVIKQDLSIIYTVASLVERYWVENRHLKPRDIVQEFERNLLYELDLQREAANASQLRRNFDNSPILHIPKIYWHYTRENIIVMERIYGIPIADADTLRLHGFDPKQLATRLLEIFFTQVFRDCFFHADMHPGNIFVSPDHPQNPQYICVDFGVVGTLGDSDKRYLAENLYAFLNRDYRRVAMLHLESGWIPYTVRIDEFENAIRTICEPMFAKPLKEISFAQLIIRLFQVARHFQMEIQPQFVLLQKTMLAIEGLGRQLYPDLDLWLISKPFLENWLKEQVSPKIILRQLRENALFFAEQLPHIPRLCYQVLKLTKEQKQRELINKNMININSEIKLAWYRGMSVTIVLTILGLIIMRYAKILQWL